MTGLNAGHQKIAVQQDPGQQIIEIVRHPSGQASDSLQTLGLRQMLVRIGWRIFWHPNGFCGNAHNSYSAREEFQKEPRILLLPTFVFPKEELGVSLTRSTPISTHYRERGLCLLSADVTKTGNLSCGKFLGWGFSEQPGRAGSRRRRVRSAERSTGGLFPDEWRRRICR